MADYTRSLNAEDVERLQRLQSRGSTRTPLSIEERAKLEIEAEGIPSNSEHYLPLVTARRVVLCQERCSVSACESCPRYDPCELVKLHGRFRVAAQQKAIHARKAVP